MGDSQTSLYELCTRNQHVLGTNVMYTSEIVIPNPLKLMILTITYIYFHNFLQKEHLNTI